MHNRRRNDLEDIPKAKKVKPDPTLDDSVSTAGRVYSKSDQFHWLALRLIELALNQYLGNSF